MDLRNRIQNDLKDSMKSGDNVARAVLRLLNSDIKNAEIEKGERLNDEDIIRIIKRSIKRHNESIEQYKKGKREDLVEQEEKELEVLKKYMPEQMSEEEIRKLVRGVIEKSGISGASNFGKVMGMVMKEVGNRAEGSVVSRIVKEELSTDSCF